MRKQSPAFIGDGFDDTPLTMWTRIILVENDMVLLARPFDIYDSMKAIEIMRHPSSQFSFFVKVFEMTDDRRMVDTEVFNQYLGFHALIFIHDCQELLIVKIRRLSSS